MYKDQQDNEEIQRKPVARAMQCANLYATWPEGQRTLRDLVLFSSAGIVSLHSVGKNRHSLSGISLNLL